jgi:hypothetical protein
VASSSFEELNTSQVRGIILFELIVGDSIMLPSLG